MENKQQALEILNIDFLLLLDVIRKNSQDEIDKKTIDELFEKTKLDDTLIPLSHSCCFAKVDLDESTAKMFEAISAIQASLISPQKEAFIKRNEKESKLYFSYRILKVLQKTKTIEGEFKEPSFEEMKNNLIENKIMDLLKSDKLTIIQTDDNLFTIIGKAYRETWDIFADLSYPYTTFRIYGSFKEKNKFSGFVCLFGSDLEKLKMIYQAQLPGIAKDLQPLFKESNNENN